MNIKHGDIITLDNGDTVKVSLELLHKKVTELVAGRYYSLRMQGNFCHARDANGGDFSSRVSTLSWQYVGKVNTKTAGYKYIFYSNDDGSVYSMWSAHTLTHVVGEIPEEFIDQ